MNTRELGVRYDKILKWAAAQPNFSLAARNVILKNRGSAPGLDGMDPAGLETYIKTRGEELRASLAGGSWRPGPLRKGRHLLLVPNLTDRLVFQALLQVLEPLFEKTFSDFSYHRPGRTLEQARERERGYRERGYGYVLSPYLESFVDMADHRVLLKFVKKRIKDGKLLEMFGAILGNILVEEGGPRVLERGIRQGGCLSILFCNIYLSEHDRRLEEEGRPFTRYGDIYRICFKSAGEAEEELKRSSGYFGGKLKVPVNMERSVIEGPEGRVKAKTTVVIYRKTAPKITLP
jgi:retron-type reverse transcriptase